MTRSKNHREFFADFDIIMHRLATLGVVPDQETLRTDFMEKVDPAAVRYAWQHNAAHDVRLLRQKTEEWYVMEEVIGKEGLKLTQPSGNNARRQNTWQNNKNLMGTDLETRLQSVKVCNECGGHRFFSPS